MSEKLCSLKNCDVIDSHYHTTKGIEFSRMELIKVLAERDCLRAQLAVAKEALEEIKRFDTTRFFEGTSTLIDSNIKVIVGPCAKIAKSALAKLSEGKP